MINDQKNAKKYKIGQQIKCRILDIDSNKNIADLSEKLVDVKVKSSEK
jgi:ribosomal protein S1